MFVNYKGPKNKMAGAAQLKVDELGAYVGWTDIDGEDLGYQELTQKQVKQIADLKVGIKSALYAHLDNGKKSRLVQRLDADEVMHPAFMFKTDDNQYVVLECWDAPIQSSIGLKGN